MEIDIDFIVYYLRLFIANTFVYYCFEKITNNHKKHIKNNIILAAVNMVLLLVYIFVKNTLNSFLSFIFMYFIYTIIISKLTKNKLGYSMIVTIMAYAMLAVIHTISVVIQFVPYKMLYKAFNIDNLFFNLSVITIIEFLLLYAFFKIRRFRNGFSFINNKLNSEVTDIVMLNISTLIIIVYCLLQNFNLAIKTDIFLTLFILGIIMFFTIRKMFTMYYKQKLLADTMEEYKAELKEKQNEIDKLKENKQNVSKITHEFYNRQKALELMVASNMECGKINKEGISPSVLSIIESLTDEYSKRFESMKELPVLDKTDIVEIDNMFKYMQSECNKNNIEFKLKISGNIHTLVNNIIPKNKLETLIGDHLRDAINAVNLSESSSKEIFAILGVKNKKYELCIMDTGINFEIDTLIKLGVEAVTTNAKRGGTGTGFMTTFNTLKETKASLIITEYEPAQDNIYTKCVTIRFDGKNEYKIRSYRAKEIKDMAKDKRIKIEKI